MKEVYFGDEFNQPIAGVVWLSSLLAIHFGYGFNQPIAGVTWPTSLVRLTLGNHFNQPITGVAWPTSLARLTLGDQFNQPITGVAWPISLQFLELVDKFNQPIVGVAWPGKVEDLYIGNDFNHPITGIVLPTSLVGLALGNNFNQPISGVAWPGKLEDLSIGNDFNQPIAEVKWPETLEYLRFGDENGEEDGERGELSEAQLLEALARHGQCWTGDSMDPSDASTKMAKVMRMGHEVTAEDRVDAVMARMEKFFQDRSAETFFLNPDGSFKRGPARVITQSFVEGLKPAGFKDKCVHELNVREGWKSDPALTFEIVLDAAVAWRTVEHDATFRQRAEARGKSGREAASTKSRSSSSHPQRSPGGAPTCYTCGAVGHKSTDCKLAGKQGSAPGGAAPGAARPQGQRSSNKKVPPAKGTPAARGGSQQQPAAAAVAGRSAVPEGAGAPAAGAASAVVPPDPLPAAGGGPSGDAPAPVSVTSSWRSVAAEGASALLSDEVAVEPCEQSCLVDLSIPGAAHPTVCPVKAVLDSGAGISTLSTCHVRKLQEAFPDVRVVEPMGQEHMLRVIDGREVRVTEKTCPVRVALHTRWGPVVVSPQRFAVVPGTDDVMIIGSPMMKLLGIDVYETAAARARAGHDARVTGIETPGVAEARRVALSVAALQPADTTEVPDEAVARLAARGPNMVMSPEEEEQGRVAALDAAIHRAANVGLSDTGVSRLRSMTARNGGRHWEAFRRALRGDPPADVPPMEVRQVPGSRAVKARPREYNPEKTMWLTSCLATLVALGMLFLNPQAVWASAVMALPKSGGTYRLVSDFRAVNKVVEKNPGVMPNLEASMQRLGKATCYGSLDMLQGYWQMPLAPASQEIFTIVGPGGLYTPTRVPQGVLNATSYFQSTMTTLLEGLNCMVWVDDVIYWGHSEDDLLDTLEQILDRLAGVGLFAAAHKCVFYDTSITWCGKVYSHGRIEHDKERLSGLASLRRPATAADEDTWEPLKTLWEDAPQFVKQQLRKMKLGRDIHKKLQQDYGISL
eukprot:g14116.t1